MPTSATESHGRARRLLAVEPTVLYPTILLPRQGLVSAARTVPHRTYRIREAHTRAGLPASALSGSLPLERLAAWDRPKAQQEQPGTQQRQHDAPDSDACQYSTMLMVMASDLSSQPKRGTSDVEEPRRASPRPRSLDSAGDDGGMSRKFAPIGTTRLRSHRHQRGGLLALLGGQGSSIAFVQSRAARQ